jgi:hypothetical protein
MTNDLMNEIYVVETPTCAWCGKGGTAEITFKNYLAYFEDRQLIQDAMPNIAAPIREQIKTGYHPQCFAEFAGGHA